MSAPTATTNVRKVRRSILATTPRQIVNQVGTTIVPATLVGKKGKDMTNKVKGAASLRIELRDGIITVYHGTDGAVLHQVEATDNMWERMFDNMTNALYGVDV